MKLQKTNAKTMVIALVALGAILALFFGEANLADFFFLIAGAIGISAYYKLYKLKEEIKETDKRISDKIEELEFKLDKLEKEENTKD